MSLNGLDDVKVREAYETAAAEPGGWFLLKYVSRDEVELLGKGNGGIVEVRNTIALFEDPSPLFGFLRYRRRNVILKYVPEDCSRLVQARVAVHFSAVAERFSPHDTEFSITSSKELKDAKLSAACSLHTASGSTSSSTSSLRRRTLMEIAEEAEEDAKRQSTVLEELSLTEKPPSTSPSSENLPAAPPTLATADSYRSMISNLETSPPPPREPEPESRPRSSSKTLDERRRKSSQSSRPDVYSLHSYSSSGKPKIKLGPRPSLDVGGRPHTSSATSSHFRPVSTLPAGLKLFSSKTPKKDKDTPDTLLPFDPTNTAISPPLTPETMTGSLQLSHMRPHTSGGRPSTSSAVSMKSAATPKTGNAFPKMPTITPEKARLMKALELRKKRELAPASPAALPSPIVEERMSLLLAAEEKRASISPTTDVHDNSSLSSEATKPDDLGIAFDASSTTMKTDESDATISDSYPVSPIGPSEPAESTKASSISESTDETVQEPHKSKTVPEDVESAIQEESHSAEQSRDIHSLVPAEVGKESEEVPSSSSISSDTESALGESDNLAAHSQATDVSILEDTVEEDAGAEVYPLLKPVAYTPVRSPTVPEVKLLVLEDRFEEAVIEPTINTEETTPKELSLSHGLQDGNHSELLPLQSGIPTPNVNSRQNEPEAALPKDDSASLSSQCKPEIKEWKVPRSKFSAQNLKAASEEVITPVEPMPLPRSKFSSQNLKVAREAPDAPSQSMPIPTEAIVNLPPVSLVGSTSSTADVTRSFTEDEQQDSGPSKIKKRRAFVEPIRTNLDTTDMDAANSVANMSSDDELMEELQSAVFQDAQPISVSKSPISPVFPSPMKKMGNRFSRAFSSPVPKESSDTQTLSTPNMGRSDSLRSVSAAFLSPNNQESAKTLAKKVNVGSTISQRIKALEKLSANTPGVAPSPGTPAPSTGATPTFYSVRKINTRATSKSPSIADRTNSLTRKTPSPSPNESRESSPETSKLRDRSGSIHNRLNSFNLSPVLSKSQQTRPESVSVTARIIRDSNQTHPKTELGKRPSEYAPLDLKQSPLVIDHQKAVVTSQPQQEVMRERRLSSSSRATSRSRRSSITVVKDLIKDGRASFAEHRRSAASEDQASSPVIMSPGRSPSFPSSVPAHQRPASNSSRRSTSSSHAALSPPTTSGSSSSTNDDKEKKSNRASRMIRRMSSPFSPTRKNGTHLMSPTVREESELLSPESRSLASSHPSNHSASSTDIGDVNVQFPDSLLWKRRSMSLDSQGTLILSPALSSISNAKEKTTGGATRRFHLSEFRAPTVPDVEMQELPNSVVLDFVEGGGLQIACEDRAGQMQVLDVLQEAHAHWAAYGQ